MAKFDTFCEYVTVCNELEETCKKVKDRKWKFPSQYGTILISELPNCFKQNIPLYQNNYWKMSEEVFQNLIASVKRVVVSLKTVLKAEKLVYG